LKENIKKSSWEKKYVIIIKNECLFFFLILWKKKEQFQDFVNPHAIIIENAVFTIIQDPCSSLFSLQLIAGLSL